MRVSPVVRNLGVAALLGGAALFALGSAAPSAEGQAAPALDGQAGFVVTEFSYGLSDDAEQTGACPDGMTAGYANMGDVFVDSPELRRQEGEVEDQYIQRVFRAAMSNADIKNLCANPELGGPDPTYRTVTSTSVRAYGIDLDGQASRTNGAPAANACAHSDFTGMNGERGVDNQFFRAVGCNKSFQSTGSSNIFGTEMLTGAWGILIALKGVDDLRNDDEVEVTIVANADPIQLSPTRAPLENATYAMDQDPRFRAVARGRIVDGVLTSETMDVRLHSIVNSIRLERTLRDARVRMTITSEGGLDGYLSGYTPVEDMYNFQFSYRNGTDASGQPAPVRLRQVSSIGAAQVLGHTCHGAYQALHALADGHRDPETGRCTSISTQYRVKAIPAFVFDIATESVNEGFDPARGGNPGAEPGADY